MLRLESNRQISGDLKLVLDSHAPGNAGPMLKTAYCRPCPLKEVACITHEVVNGSCG